MVLSFGLGVAMAGPLAVVGAKAVVVVPALIVATIAALIPYSQLYMIIATGPINVQIVGPITVARLVIVFAFGVAILQGFLRIAPFPRVFIWPGGTIATAFFAWVVIASIAVGTSGLVERLGPYLIYAVFLFVLLNYVDTERRMRHVFLLLVMIGTAQSLLVIAEAKFNFVPFGGVQAEAAAERGSAVRVVGTSVHPIILAGFFQVVIGSALLLAAITRSVLARLILVAVCGLALLGWWYTFSRSSWVGMAAMIFVGMLLASRPTRILAVLGGSFLLLVLSFFDFSPSALIRYIDSFNAISQAASGAGAAAASESFSWRVENWTAALSMFSESPIFGVGIDRSDALMLSHMPPGSLGHQYILPAVVHNIFLLVLTETGLPAFVLFVALWVSAAHELRLAARVERLRPYAIGLTAVMTGQFVTFMLNPMPREIWLTLGLAFALGRLARTRMGLPGGQRPGATQANAAPAVQES